MNYRSFEALGFSPSYSCQPDPELPGDGDWRCPVHGFGRDGRIAAGPLRSRGGAPLIARFELADRAQWVGLFEAGGLGGIDGVFACPDPDSAKLQLSPGDHECAPVNHDHGQLPPAGRRADQPVDLGQQPGGGHQRGVVLHRPVAAAVAAGPDYVWAWKSTISATTPTAIEILTQYEDTPQFWYLTK